MGSTIWTWTPQDCPCYNRAVVQCQFCSYQKFSQSLCQYSHMDQPIAYQQVDYFENLPPWNRQYFGLNTGYTFSGHAFTYFSCNVSSKTYINKFKEFSANFFSDIVSTYKIYITSTEEKQQENSQIIQWSYYFSTILRPRAGQTSGMAFCICNYFDNQSTITQKAMAEFSRRLYLL